MATRVWIELGVVGLELGLGLREAATLHVSLDINYRWIPSDLGIIIGYVLCPVI